MSALVFPLAAVGAIVKARAPYTDVRVDQAVSGKEARSTWWGSPRWRYKIGFDVLRSDTRQDYQQLASFYARHFGQLDSFLITDPEDNAVTAHGFGVGDNATTAFQLQRSMLGSVYDVLGGPWPVSSTPRTNLVVRSQEFDNASWTKGATTVTANALLAPDGTQTADSLLETATTAGHSVSGANVTPANGVAHTFSVWVKANGRTQVQLTIASNNATFDLSAVTATLGVGVSAAISAQGNGWFRCSLSFTGAGALAVPAILIISGGLQIYAGDITKGLYLWGAQVEAATAATQYIATTSAAVTVTPAYWPAYTDGFEPVNDLNPAGGTTIFVNGVAKVLGTDYTLSSTGLVTFGAAPASNAVLTWSGQYYRRCRFMDDQLSFDRMVQQMWTSNLQLVSVK